MFRRTLISGLIFLDALGFASDKPISPSDFCARIEIASEVFVYNDTGEVLLKRMGESQKARTAHWLSSKQVTDQSEVCSIRSAWASESSSFKGVLYVLHEWKVAADGRLTVAIKQFSDREGKDLVKEQTILVKDMAPVVWISAAHKDERLVVRFVPGLSDDESPADLEKLAISGTDMVVVDNSGNLWANYLTVTGTYLSFDSLQGTLALSYYPFPGAKLLGGVSGNTIELRLPKNKIVSLFSKSDFLPYRTRAKVYGIYYPQIKSKSLGSQSVSSSSEEKEFLQKMERMKEM